MGFQEIFVPVMYSLIALVFTIVILKLIHDKIKYGKFFEDDVPSEKLE